MCKFGRDSAGFEADINRLLGLRMMSSNNSEAVIKNSHYAWGGLEVLETLEDSGLGGKLSDLTRRLFLNRVLNCLTTQHCGYK